jgi:hypothetical protein
LTRRSTILRPGELPGSHDGTSQRARALPALDPTTARIDERDNAELVRFVQAFTKQLRYFTANTETDELHELGSWAAFAENPDISIADILAYMREGEAANAEHARWLGRPHFALLLTFLELFGHAREQLNGLTARHLDYYYGEVLQMRPLPPRPDRAAVIVRLAGPGLGRPSMARLAAGTALDAGRDKNGVPRIYRTERELIVSRAEVAELRSVFVDRRIIEIPNVRDDRSLTAAGAFEQTLRLALGSPKPGDALPKWRAQTVDFAFVRGLASPLSLCRSGLYLEHHELRTLMRLVRRRDAGLEWPVINDRLGYPPGMPADPRNFMVNLAQAIAPAVLDFKNDGLPQVANIDDLYNHRNDQVEDPDQPGVFLHPVADYINNKLAKIGGLPVFAEIMPLKLRVDGEWFEINRLLERAGRRKRSSASWQFAQNFNPVAFNSNLQTALSGALPSWPVANGWQCASIYDYEARVRELEGYFALPVERLERVVAFASELEGDKAEIYDWSEIDRLLADAHREHIFAQRRAQVTTARVPDTRPGFVAAVNFVLSALEVPPLDPLAWPEARALLSDAGLLDSTRLTLLDRFDAQFDSNHPRSVEWPEVERVLELAWRTAEQLPDPVARKVEWHNLHAFTDARTCIDEPTSKRFKVFGTPAPSVPGQPPAPLLGWSLRSDLLSLSEGTRTIKLTLGFAPGSFDRTAFLLALGFANPQLATEPALRAAIGSAWIIQLSGAKGFIEPQLVSVALASGTTQQDDYWSLAGLPHPSDEHRGALSLELRLGPEHDPIVAIPDELGGQPGPRMRVLLRPRWDGALEQWTTQLQPFEDLQLAGVHLRVDVQGLRGVKLQQDDRILDARKPFEPFGNRPEVGSRLYLSHPELVRARLDQLRVEFSWMGKYGLTAASFVAKLALVDRNLELALQPSAQLFANDTSATQTLTLDVANLLANGNPGFNYTRRLDLEPSADLRTDSRHFLLELRASFGHAAYGALAANNAAALATAIVKDQITAQNPVSNYQVNPPYTPKLERLSVGYVSSLELDVASLQLASVPGQGSQADTLIHIHPFGESELIRERPPMPALPTLLPRYDMAGELYIGLRELASPQRLTLLVQLAEGTSDPELEPAAVSWSCLDGDRWRDLDLLDDSTRGLLNSGIVELELPSVAPSSRLPGPLQWLRVAIPRATASVCDCVDIRAQAVTVRFEDRGNAAEHYSTPLPQGTIKRLVEHDATFAAIEQPFTSFGGVPGERPEQFRTRVSERLRHKQRALSPWDYERLVLQRFGQIFKVKCLPVERELGRVVVLVVPDIRNALPGDAFAPRAAADLLADIQTYVTERAPTHATISVRNPTYVPVRLRLSVRFRPGQDPGYAKRRLNDDLLRFLSPWAFDDGAELMIGGSIYANSILDFVDRREYVDYVADITLFRGRGQDDFALIPRDSQNPDYHIAAEHPDEVLVAAPQHDIDVISELGYEQASFTGINYMKIELDFIVHE